MELWDLADGIGSDGNSIPVSFKDFCEAADEFSKMLIEGGKPDNLIKMYNVHFSDVRENTGDVSGSFYEALQSIEDAEKNNPGTIDFVECGVRREDGSWAAMSWGVGSTDILLYDCDLYGVDNSLFYREDLYSLKEKYDKYGITPGSYHNDFLIRLRGFYGRLEVLDKEEAFTQERNVLISDWKYCINPIALKGSRSFKELNSAGVRQIEFPKDDFLEGFGNLSDNYGREKLLLFLRDEAKRVNNGEELSYEFGRVMKFGDYSIDDNVKQMMWSQDGLECRKEVLSIFIDIVVDILKKYEGLEDSTCESIEYAKSEVDGREIVLYHLMGAKPSVLKELNIQCNFTDVLKYYRLLPGEDNLRVLEEKKNYLLSLEGDELIREVRNLLPYMGLDYYGVDTLERIFLERLYNNTRDDKSLTLAEEIRAIAVAGISQAISTNKEDDSILLNYLQEEFYKYCDWEYSYSNTSISRKELKRLIAERLFSEYKDKKGTDALLCLLRQHYNNDNWEHLCASIKMTDAYLAPDGAAGRPKCSEVKNSSFWEYYYYQCTADLNDVHWEGVIQMSTYYSGGWN